MKQHNLDIEYFQLDEIESIELIGDELTVDITVDDTHLFFANNIYTHNSGADQDIISGDKVADSFAKIMVADFVFSLSRRTGDKIAGTGKWHVIKNRFGLDGITFPSKNDMSICRIDIYAENTAQGTQTLKDSAAANNGNRAMLQQRFKELM